MVGRHEALRLSAWSHERTARRIVGPIRQKLKCQKRVRRPTLAQVDFDCVDLPFATLVVNGDEVHGEPAENALPHQTVADLRGLAHDRRAVLRIRGKAAAQIGLSANARNFGSAPYIGIPSWSARSRSSLVVLKGTR